MKALLDTSFLVSVLIEGHPKHSPVCEALETMSGSDRFMAQHSMAELYSVLTTYPIDGDADRLAKALVDERLAACVNVLPPMRSIYTWKGATEQADERQLVIKTSRHRLRDLEIRVRELHPYDVPEFLVLPILEGSRDYLSWVADSTK